MGIQGYVVKQLRADEEILSVIRTSLAHYRWPLVVWTGVLVLDFFLFYPLVAVGKWGVVIFFAVLVLVILNWLRLAFLWTHNIFVLTNQRLIDFDQRRFFERHVAECPLQHIQEIRYSSRGLSAVLFRVGTVVVDCGSLSGHIELVDVANPGETKELIMNAHHNHTKNTDERQGI